MSKRIKNLVKLTILIATRQAYFLGRNIYLFAEEPYLTLKKVVEDRDKSQIFLIMLTALTPTIGYVAGRIIYDLWKYQRMVFLTGDVFVLTVIIQTVILGYLAYWIFKVIKSSK